MNTPIEPSKIDQLQERFGTHERVAKALGISPRHYIRIRQGKHVTETMKRFVDALLSKEIESV